MMGPANAIKSITVRRCPGNPLITFESSPSLGENINGPSVVRAPAWVKQPLGKCYMYFAHHRGKYIRLAYADKVEGPWKTHEPGTLKLEQAKAFVDHIASPDVHVDARRREMRMYFHGPARARAGQWTGVAVSKNGLDFEASEKILGNYYFRAFRWKGAYYAISKLGDTGWGELSRSHDGLKPFEVRGRLISRVRHTALLIRGKHLIVFYTRVGDAPERILAATVDLSGDWKQWAVSEPIEVMKPETEYEGASYPNKPSKPGPAIKAQQLRDPCIFEEGGKTYLFYSVAGEMGIGMAEVEIKM